MACTRPLEPQGVPRRYPPSLPPPPAHLHQPPNYPGTEYYHPTQPVQPYNPIDTQGPAAIKRDPHDEGPYRPQRHSTEEASQDGLPPSNATIFAYGPPQQTSHGNATSSQELPPLQVPQPAQEQPWHGHMRAHDQPATMIEAVGFAANKRKAVRVSQACDSCRGLKSKCDEQKPCKTCRARDIECKYREMLKPVGKPETIAAQRHQEVMEAFSEMSRKLDASHARRPESRLPESGQPSCPSPDYSEAKVREYYNSFVKHVPIMYPIITTRDLDVKVTSFMDTFAAAGMTPQKRKRSTGDPQEEPQKRGRPHRNLKSALVFVVLALGKLLLQREKMRDATQVSGEDGEESPKLNHRSLAGLEYLTDATDILGHHHGTSTIGRVQTLILAALCYDQLGLARDRDRHLLDADRALQAIIEDKMNHFEGMKKAQTKQRIVIEEEDNVVLLNFWSYLQLRNDILTESSGQQQGVLRYEDVMPWADASVLDMLSQRDQEAYLAQLFLRKTVNALYQNLYPPVDVSIPLRTKFDDASHHRDMPRKLRLLSKGLGNSEDDLADNPIEARLRATYWDIQAMFYRWFISLALDDTAAGMGAFCEEEFAEGIRALVKSAEAFHRAEGNRPLVANIFNAVHAQRETLSILAAAWQNEFLMQFIIRDDLFRLFDQTISMLDRYAASFSALTVDKAILERTRQQLFDTRLCDVGETEENIGSLDKYVWV